MELTEKQEAIKKLEEELELVETLSRLQESDDFKLLKYHFIDLFQERYLEQAMFILEENRQELQEGMIGRSQFSNFINGSDLKSADEIKEQIEFLEKLEEK